MLAIFVTNLLQAVIREVNVVIFVRERIVGARRPDVAFLVHIEIVLAGKKGPDSDVELPALEEQRLLDVFLDYPEAVRRCPGR